MVWLLFCVGVSELEETLKFKDEPTWSNSNAPSEPSSPTWSNSFSPSLPDRRIIRNKNKKNKYISCSSHDERYSDSHSEFDFESFWAKYPRKQNRLKHLPLIKVVCIFTTFPF